MDTISVVFTADETSTYGVALTERLRSTAGASGVRCSPVVDSWDGLTDVSTCLWNCFGACVHGQ